MVATAKPSEQDLRDLVNYAHRKIHAGMCAPQDKLFLVGMRAGIEFALGQAPADSPLYGALREQRERRSKRKADKELRKTDQGGPTPK